MGRLRRLEAAIEMNRPVALHRVAGHACGQNVTVEYRSFTALSDLVRRRVAVIVAGGILPAKSRDRDDPDRVRR
jgi:hypothetical protein